MRIGLLISELSQKNGWAQYSLRLAQSLKKQGVDLRIISARNAIAYESFSQISLLPCVTPPDNYALVQMALAYPKLRRELADCDIIHSTIEAYAPLAVALAGKRPCFITAHGSYINLPRFRKFPVNLFYRQAFRRSHIITVSNYTARVAQEIIPDAHITVIPNAVDFETYGSLKHQTSARPSLLSTGGVKARKGTLELVRAVAKVRETIPNVQAIVLGNMHAEPNYLVKVQAEIAHHNLQDHVQLLGFVSHEELLDWYSKADIFVLPSFNSGWKFEGFGLVHLEASAAGLPVIGTTDCGAEDAIIHGETGLLVKQAQVADELPIAILDLLNNPQKTRQMGAAGRKHAQAQTWDKVGREVLTAYEAALKQTPLP